jgi:hypothetical protein
LNTGQTLLYAQTYLVKALDNAVRGKLGGSALTSNTAGVAANWLNARIGEFSSR